MAVFEYKALGADGATSEGRIDAQGRQEALRQLAERGMKPLRLAEQSSAAAQQAKARASAVATADEAATRKKVPHAALENFTRQLANLLGAGVSLSRALQILTRESSSPAAAARWRSIHDLVIDGMGLADAMAQHRDTFPRVYIAMVRAGETGGFLELVLNQIADFHAMQKELTGKVRSALIYPCVLMLMAVGVLIFLLTFFIPRFRPVFEGLGGDLPVLTKVVIAASEILIGYGPFVAIGIFLVVYFTRQWLATEAGRRAWQMGMLRMPVIGPLNSRFAMARFCRMLGTLLGSGVALITGLRVARESIGNQTLVDAMDNTIERVQKGESLAASLSDTRELFPPSVIEMISVAEESGRMDKELIRLAGTAERELDSMLRAAVSLAEPLILFAMAAFIGVIFAAMVIPIFTIQDYIK